MRQKPAAALLFFVISACVSAVLSGCVNGPFPLGKMSQALRLPPGPTPALAQTRELQSRAAGLDAANQDLNSKLVQQEQRAAQLQSALQRSEREKAELRRSLEQEHAAGPAAAKPGKRGASAAPVGYDGQGTLPMAQIRDAEVVRDGELVRIRLTTEKLFSPGKADLKPDVKSVLDSVADALRRQYSGRLVGVEGHTDPDPIRKSKWRSNHELAVARSVSVFQALKQRGVPESQLFVAGFGPNRPLAANRDRQGKAQNRRVEIVIYPESARASN